MFGELAVFGLSVTFGRRIWRLVRSAPAEPTLVEKACIIVFGLSERQSLQVLNALGEANARTLAAAAGNVPQASKRMRDRIRGDLCQLAIRWGVVLAADELEQASAASLAAVLDYHWLEHRAGLQPRPELNLPPLTLDPLAKAAILVMTLPVELSARLFPALGPERLQRLTQRISTLPRLTLIQQQAVVAEFLRLAQRDWAALCADPPAMAAVLAEHWLRMEGDLMRVVRNALILALLAALGVGSVVLWQQRGRWMPPPSDVDRHRGAIWMAHRWLGKPPSEQECRKVGQELARLGFRDLYFHAGPLDAKGRIPAWDRREWNRTQAIFRESIPGLRSFAWVSGVTVRGYGLAPDTVDISVPEVREAVIDTCKVLLDEGSFDGVQYELDPVENLDPYFLTFLEESRVVLGTHRLISVAAPPAWDKPYFKLVAQRCDQLALKCYGQSFKTAEQYEGWLESLIPIACEQLKGLKCTLVVGVSTQENLLTGLVGVKRGLERTPDRSSFQGLGIYAHWTTEPAGWKTLKSCWLPW